MRTPFSLLAGLALLGAAGCDQPIQGCTLIGCSDQVALAIVDNGGLPSGTFDVAVTVDRETRSCWLTVEDREVTAGDCPARIETLYAGDRTVLRLVLSYEVTRTASPEVSVRVEQAGAVRADEAVPVTVETFAPNGVDCGPICRVLRASVDVQ